MTYEEKWERAVQARMACANEERPEAEKAVEEALAAERAARIERAAELIPLLDEMAVWAAARQCVEDAEMWAGRPLTEEEQGKVFRRSMAASGAMREFNDRLREDFGGGFGQD